METDLINIRGQTELPPVFSGQVPSYLELTCGERPFARIDRAVARPGLNATGDPEDDEEEEEEEEEEKKKLEEDEKEDEEEEEENDGEEEEVPWQVAVPRLMERD